MEGWPTSGCIPLIGNACAACIAGLGCIIIGPVIIIPPGCTMFCADDMTLGVAALECAGIIMDIMVVWLGAGTVAAAVAVVVVV